MILRIFNPSHDECLASGSPYYTPSRTARLMDEVHLPGWHCLSDDLPSWQDLERVEPWGWDARLVHQLRRRGCPDHLLPSPERLATIRRLSSRQTAVRLLPMVTERFESWWVGATSPHSLDHSLSPSKFPSVIGFSRSPKRELCHPSPCREGKLPLKDASASLTAGVSSPSQQGEGWQGAVGSPDEEGLGESRWFLMSPSLLYKSPWSCSGRGVFTYDEKRIRKVMREQGGIEVEPLYPRVADFAMEFRCEGGEVTFLGLSAMLNGGTSARGAAYGGNLVASDETIMELMTRYVPKKEVTEARDRLLDVLRREIAPFYDGPLGVDQMIVGPPYALHPLVELNLRHTMGLVAIEMRTI
ncbi:MAG: hypothetical protein MJZ54_04775 [Bacteroidaceae bacterium]|nr:hypothetical protein [Bacteroidaceae bacterium]